MKIVKTIEDRESRTFFFLEKFDLMRAQDSQDIRSSEGHASAHEDEQLIILVFQSICLLK